MHFDVRHKMKRLTPAFWAILVALATGCTPIATHDEQFARTLQELKMTDVSQWPNSILVGEMFPNGRTLPVSDDQARQFQRIILEARPTQGDPADSGRMISPAPRLCVLSLAGQTWYFMPPGQPVTFVLPAPQQKEFEKIMKADFGLKD
jgi:hypothetical protein